MKQSLDLKPKKPDIFNILLIVFMIGTLSLSVVALSGMFNFPKPNRLPTPTMQPFTIQAEDAPTLNCGEPVLTIGTANLRIQTVEAAADGTFNIPTESDSEAYWLNGTTTNYVFALSPTPDNLALGETLTAGELVSITWANCEVTTFTLAAPELGSSFDLTNSNQPKAGIILFIQNAPAGEGFVVKGSPMEAQMISTDTPALRGPGIESEIALLETSTSQDKSKLLVNVSILNYGVSEFRVTKNDVWLIPQNASPLAPSKVKPSLPRVIKPGVTETFNFTFPRPAVSTAVLKIFSVEYDLEGF